MHTARSYLYRRIKWTTDSTLKRFGAEPGRRWRIVVASIILSVIGTAVHSLIIFVSANPYPEWDLLLERWLLWVAYIGAPAFSLWMLYWIRSAGELDRQLQDEIVSLEGAVSDFKGRLRPDIWITPDIHEDVIKGMENSSGYYRAGFSVENRSDKDLISVQIDLIRLDQWFEQVNGPSDFAPYTIFSPPVALEWSPQEQNTSGVLETKIPAGSSRWIGVFEDSPQSGLGCLGVLSANHEVRESLVLIPDRYRFKIRLSAQGIPAIESQCYEVTRWDIFEITPMEPVQLVNPRAVEPTP